MNTSWVLLILWTSYHNSLIVSRILSQRISYSLLKYANNKIRCICMNMDGIWILHLIKFHIPNLNCVTALSPHLLPLIWTKIYYIQSPSEKRRKNITQVSANSREKDIMSGESSAKKHRVFQLTTSSCTNHIFPSV